jgi:hypothetical protein
MFPLAMSMNWLNCAIRSEQPLRQGGDEGGDELLLALVAAEIAGGVVVARAHGLQQRC